VPPRPTPPPIFAVTILPFAAGIGYVTIAAPYWLSQQGVSLALIGAMSATSMLPHAIKFLWAPLIDVGSHRKAWFLSMTLATAAALTALALVKDPAQHLGLFTLVATLAQIAGTTSSAAADGLMAVTTADADKGKSGGWRMAGNVGGTGVLGAVSLELASRFGAATAGLGLAAIVVVCCAAVFFIHEPHPVDAAVEQAGSLLRALGLRFAAIARDVWKTVRSREGWTGIVICLMPVGAGALTNLFSAMAGEYHASGDVVAMVNGLGGGLIGAAGSLVGGFVADKMNRRLAYALSGGVTGLSAIAMMLAPMTPATFTWGTLLYNFANGMAFATLAAFALEMVGNSVAAATKYTVFIAIANIASSYVTALDGWGSELRNLGARGSMLVDAVLTFAGIAVLIAMVRFTRRRDAAARLAGGVA
jgi:PAT family beta-lactamase induction signal transducer AmpG